MVADATRSARMASEIFWSILGSSSGNRDTYVWPKPSTLVTIASTGPRSALDFSYRKVSALGSSGGSITPELPKWYSWLPVRVMPTCCSKPIALSTPGAVSDWATAPPVTIQLPMPSP